MRAHEGTLGPATLTDRSANGLLAELGAPDRYERTCRGDRAYDAMVNNFRASQPGNLHILTKAQQPIAQESAHSSNGKQFLDTTQSVGGPG
jgi:hypothetical protein